MPVESSTTITHSPAPWRAEPPPVFDSGNPWRVMAHGQLVAIVVYGSLDKLQPAEGNARLIASSPTMAEAGNTLAAYVLLDHESRQHPRSRQSCHACVRGPVMSDQPAPRLVWQSDIYRIVESWTNNNFFDPEQPDETVESETSALQRQIDELRRELRAELTQLRDELKNETAKRRVLSSRVDHGQLSDGWTF